jgi:hypothetical protein
MTRSSGWRMGARRRRWQDFARRLWRDLVFWMRGMG